MVIRIINRYGSLNAWLVDGRSAGTREGHTRKINVIWARSYVIESQSYVAERICSFTRHSRWTVYAHLVIAQVVAVNDDVSA
jgi:hypothetical protein